MASERRTESHSLRLDTERQHMVGCGLTLSGDVQIYLVGANTERYGDPEVVVWLNAAQARRLAEHLVDLAGRIES